MKVRRIDTEATYDLRSRVLRPGQPLAACRYPEDGAAVHFGLFDDSLVSIVTAHPEENPLFAVRGQWRIRGMATEPVRRGEGLGRQVLEALLSWGEEQGIPLFWCNAREVALGFYSRAGFRTESEFFDIPGIGPHKVMRIDLAGWRQD
jgi:GNAT superfamily N-acetyltransferase